uniref:ENV2 protein n=1 Tax=Cyanoderma ruficeps TaxID=181631 RepID=A0A8C3P353_9PASS
VTGRGYAAVQKDEDIKWCPLKSIKPVLPMLSYPSDSHHPYRPHVWTFKNFISGAVIGQLETNTPAWTVRLADIFTNDRSGKTSRDIAVQTYWCPSHNPAKKQCTRPGYWFCGHWGCETIVTGYRRWRPPREDVFLKVTGWPHDCVFGTKYQGRKIGTCTHLTITVLQPQDPSWAMGRLWSVYQHDDAPLIKDPDLGTVIQIIRAPTHKRHIAVGPNELATFMKNTPSATVSPEGERSSVTATVLKPARVIPAPKDQAQNLFTRMLYAAFLSLNALQPNLTESCWLCYDSRPSFYEGIGSNRTFQYSQEATLKEECCTYVNHSGPIRQSMTELKERLERRPVIVIILALLFGPCMLNKIAQFVKARLSKIEIMVLQQRQLT